MTEAGELVVEIRGREVGLQALLTRTESDLHRTDRAAQQAGRGIGEGLGRGAQTARGSMTALQQAQARLEASTGQYAQAIQRLENLHSSFNATSVQSINVERQLVTVRNQATRAAEQQAAAQSTLSQATGGLAGKFSALQGALGPLGLALSVAGVAQYGLDAIQAANSLERTEATVRALSGSQSKYNELLALAKTGQMTYGGSLEQNIRGLGGLVNLSNRAGIELKNLDNIARRLATVDPLQGIEGAGYALKEFFSQNSASAAKSLVERFELSPALKDIAASGGSAQEKMAALDAELNKLGITNEVLTGATNTNAQAFVHLQAAADTLKVSIGGALAGLLAPAAEGAVSMLTLGERVAQLNQQVIAGANTYDLYTTKAAIANQQLASLGARLPTLTQAQFTYIQSLVATGTSLDQAITKAQQFSGAFTQVQQFQIAAQALGATKTEIDAVSAAMVNAATQVPASAAAIQDLYNAYVRGALSAHEFRAALEAMVAGYQRQEAAEQRTAATTAAYEAIEARRAQTTQQATQATDESTDATLLSGDALAKQAEKSQESALQSQQLAQFQSTLASLAGPVSGGHMSNANAASILAAQYNVAEEAARGLIAAQAALAGAGGFTGALSNQRAGERSGGKFNSTAEIKQAKEAAKAQEEYNLALGSAAQKQGIYNQRLADAKRFYGENSAEYIRAKLALDQFTASQAKASRGGGGGGGGKKGKKAGGGGGGAGAAKISEEQKTANKIADVQESASNKYEDAEADHQKRVLQIIQDAAKKRKDAEAAFQQGSLDSRASFYKSLAGVEDAGLRQAMSARYEQAAQEAQQIAASQGPDVAKAFFDAQKEAIASEGDIQSSIVQATKDKDKDKAEYLKGVLALEQAANAARIDAIKAGGSDIENERAAQLADEESRYAESQTKIAETNNRATQKVITNAERRGAALDPEIVKANQLADAYDRIGGPGATTTGATRPAVPSTASTAPAVPVTPAAGAQPVFDSGVVQALGSVQTAIASLMPLLDSVRAATERGSSDVAGAVRSLRSGVVR